MTGRAETQESVLELCERHYPGEDAVQKFLNLVEEVVELGAVIGASPEAVRRAVEVTLAKSDDPVGDPGFLRKEVGDVQLSVFNLAGSLGIDALAQLGAVMAGIRARSPDESAARAARKRALGLKA